MFAVQAPLLALAKGLYTTKEYGHNQCFLKLGTKLLLSHLSKDVNAEETAIMIHQMKPRNLWTSTSTLYRILSLVNLLNRWNTEGCSLSSSILCTCKYVTACQSNGYTLLLYWRWSFKALLIYAHQELPLQEVVLKLIPLCSCNILCSDHRS